MSTLQATNIKSAASASNNIVLDASGNATFAGTAAMGSSFLRNRIINGDMRIDQRNAGASVTTSASGSYYAVDRTLFFKDSSANFTLQRSTVAPTGFNSSLLVTVTSAASSTAAQAVVIQQSIEGFNTADFGWGNASAQTVTLSFWVRSSLTGTYCVAFRNDAFNRSYVAQYTISAANTWEYKTVTVPGDVTGTWLTDNSAGVRLGFDLGSGTNSNGTAGAWAAAAATRTTSQANFANTASATFYLTGVQLEVGTAATPFERRQFGQELALCQRYFQTLVSQQVYGGFFDQTIAILNANFPVETRVSPTSSFPSSLTNSIEQWGVALRSPTFVDAVVATPKSFRFAARGMGSTGATIGNPAIWVGGTISLSAEL